MERWPLRRQSRHDCDVLARRLRMQPREVRRSDESLARHWQRIGLLTWVMIHLGVAHAAAYEIVNRWSTTQIDGSRLRRGDPATLRWSVVPDGSSYSRSANSQVVDFLDDGWGVRQSRRTPDYTSRPWWTVINNAYAQYGRVSGVSMVYVPESRRTGQVPECLAISASAARTSTARLAVSSPTTLFRMTATCGSTSRAKRRQRRQLLQYGTGAAEFGDSRNRPRSGVGPRGIREQLGEGGHGRGFRDGHLGTAVRRHLCAQSAIWGSPRT